MLARRWLTLSPAIVLAILVSGLGAADQPRDYNGPYTGAHLNQVAFPIGGIGAGMFCVEGTGAISHMSVRNRMEFFHEPCTFAAVCVKGDPNVARVLEGPIPDWKYFGRPGTGNGAAGTAYGLPRFDEAECLARFPFATIDIDDDDIPLDVTITAWSPFIPGDADNSSLPVGALEYCFANPTKTRQEAVFSFNTKNFVASGGRGNTILPFKNGFALSQDDKAGAENQGTFAVWVDDGNVVVDHCWFKGGWWDALTLAWRNVREGTLLKNPPAKGPSPGASLFVPFTLEPGQEKTVRLMTAWHFPNTKIRIGANGGGGPAFTGQPSRGTASGQQEVTGFLGKGLINTFDPSGDGPSGTLTSPPLTVKDRYIHFLVAGGSSTRTGVELVVDGKAVQSARGQQTENLEWATWDVSALKGKEVRIRIVDKDTTSWGHICVDHIIASDKPLADLRAKDGNALTTKRGFTVIEDFEGKDYGDWVADPPVTAKTCGPGETCAPGETCEPRQYHAPWYAGRFADIDAVAAYWRDNYDALRAKSALFRDTFYDTTLPPEVIEAVAANLTILKSPTVLRQPDGKLWCFEGCSDGGGCCHGSCTHVWNYAQAIPHLFPALERSLRQTEFHESQAEDGRQAFRANLPIRPGAPGGAASDGQLGGIMKMYREWRISGDTEWIESYWPRIRQSLDYIITSYDPRETGLLEESHHNTYDINYFGPDGHCGSFYLGALTAAVRMGEALGDDVSRYQALLDKGAARLEAELYNGEYFYQKIMTEGLDNNPGKLNPASNSPGYQDVVELLNQQGPKYQYGTGCLSDGILGFWMARVCGLDDAIVDSAKVKSNLKAIHTYNLKRDLSNHANPQRPAFAMGDDGGLLLCTWPHGGALAIPFVYSDEVWTGIEYQVASHLMLEGMVEEGLDIVRVCRDRYDGVRRNPFNEYECGHWYARAMSSYGLLQGLTGARYDAVDKTLYIDSQVGDFRAFLSTATGYGTVGLKRGKPFLEVKSGTIEIEKVVVAERELALL
jgi:uncharacterized protein (DUF608 family)